MLAVVEELPQGERTGVKGGVARTRGDLPSDLRLIHGGLGVQTAEDEKKINCGEGRHGDEKKETQNERLQPAGLDLVDEILNVRVFLMDHVQCSRVGSGSFLAAGGRGVDGEASDQRQRGRSA